MGELEPRLQCRAARSPSFPGRPGAGRAQPAAQSESGKPTAPNRAPPRTRSMERLGKSTRIETALEDSAKAPETSLAIATGYSRCPYRCVRDTEKPGRRASHQSLTSSRECPHTRLHPSRTEGCGTAHVGRPRQGPALDVVPEAFGMSRRIHRARGGCAGLPSTAVLHDASGTTVSMSSPSICSRRPSGGVAVKGRNTATPRPQSRAPSDRAARRPLPCLGGQAGRRRLSVSASQTL